MIEIKVNENLLAVIYVYFAEVSRNQEDVRYETIFAKPILLE